MTLKMSTTKDYNLFLSKLKEKIKTSQLKASISVNKEMILLYWNIGKEILSNQEKLGWGAKVIDQLSLDLKKSFPEMKGFSSRNLKYMRKFAETYPDHQFVQQVVAQIPWGHNVRILDYIKEEKKRIWYINKTIENNWSRNVLVHQIESGLYERQGTAINNFENTLPKPNSDLAKEILKDPYLFDFLTIDEKARERELEKALLVNIRDFLLELGKGFAFVGNQYHLNLGGEDFYIDLLFYHLQLRSYVVIELKQRAFKPEDAGKMNFYLSAVDDLIRHAEDQPAIGIIICKTKNKIIAEYALRDTNKPIGISSYELTKQLPVDMQSSLPSIEDLENELSERNENE